MIEFTTTTARDWTILRFNISLVLDPNELKSLPDFADFTGKKVAIKGTAPAWLFCKLSLHLKDAAVVALYDRTVSGGKYVVYHSTDKNYPVSDTLNLD